MEKKELLKVLKKLQKAQDPESEHGIADDALLAYIGDEEIAKEYNKIKKWYA